MVEGTNEKITRKEIAKAIKVMKPENAAGPSEFCGGMISTHGEVGTSMMAKLVNDILDGKGMPNERQTVVLVPIFKGKGDVRSYDAH